MKKLRWRRIILLLIILILLGAVLNFFVRMIFPHAQNDQISTPSSSATIQKNVNNVLSNSEKNEIIEKAKNQAIQAARASGQTEEEANKFGQLAAKEIENNLNKATNTH